MSLPLHAALLALALLASRAAAQCAPGFYTFGSGCTPCAANKYSFGGAALSCASCPGSTFISATEGCRPDWGNAAPALAAPALMLDGFAAASVALGTTGAASVAADYKGVPDGALSLGAGQIFTTATLPQLPTGGAARAFAAWVKCPATSSGVIMEFGENSTNPVLQSLSLRATPVATPAAFNWPWYNSTIVAGNPPTTTLAGVSDGVGTAASFSAPASAP